MSRESDALLAALPVVFELIERAITARSVDAVITEAKRDALLRAYSELLLERQRMVLARAKGTKS